MVREEEERPAAARGVRGDARREREESVGRVRDTARRAAISISMTASRELIAIVVRRTGLEDTGTMIDTGRQHDSTRI